MGPSDPSAGVSMFIVEIYRSGRKTSVRNTEEMLFGQARWTWNRRCGGVGFGFWGHFGGDNAGVPMLNILVVEFIG